MANSAAKSGRRAAISQREYEVIQERVICGENDPDLPTVTMKKHTFECAAAETRPHQYEFERQCEKRGRRSHATDSRLRASPP